MNICVCITESLCVHLKLTQHYKSTILPWEKKLVWLWEKTYLFLYFNFDFETSSDFFKVVERVHKIPICTSHSFSKC